MKTIIIAVILLGMIFCADAQISTNQPSRFKMKIISYEGKIESGVNDSFVSFVPDDPGTGGGDTVTTSGHESELKWTFSGRNGDKDVYRFTFTRMTKIGSSSKTTDSKEIQFAGKQIVVFEDDLHTVVMESPNAEELKTAAVQHR
ncbi:MAG: hypothetical protein QOD03_1368 [Verrucomicrobiota bacterium]|jgi:hypothetical protein